MTTINTNRDKQYRIAVTTQDQQKWGYPLLLTGQDRVYGAIGQGIPLYDWPVPKAPAPHRENRTWLETLVGSTLVGQDSIYAGPGEVPTYDWPLPQIRQPHRENRTLLENLVGSTLVGKDSFYAGPGEVPPFTWPVPLGYPASRENRTYLLNEQTLFSGVAAALPQGMQAWPDWAKAAPRNRLADSGTPLNLGPLVGKDVIYGASGQVPIYTWTVPTGYPPYRENRTLSMDAEPLLTLAAIASTLRQLAVTGVGQ